MNSDDNNTINDLKKIREDKGISLEEVADRLKLTSETIRKIEDSEFDNLGAYIYIQGYIKHYSEMLEVDPKKYLALVPKEQQNVPLINTRSNNSKTIKFKRQSKSFASYALGTFIVVAISFSGWFLLKNYQGISKNNRNGSEIVSSNNIEITPQQQTSLDETSHLNSQTEEQFHLSSIIPTIEEDSAIEQPSALPENETTNKVDTDTPTESLEKDDSLGDIQENADLTKKIKDLSYEVIISTNQTSWVKVEHLNGSKLHNDLLQPGDITLKSDKPLHFRIGNQDNVKVTINGVEIKLAKFAHKNIADFNWPIDT